MSGLFPPSSPILGSVSICDGNPEGAFYQPSSDDVYPGSNDQHLDKSSRPLRKGQISHTAAFQVKNRYPTPVASSSTGRSSSPFRAAPEDTLSLSPAYDLPELAPNTNKLIEIELDSINFTRLAIGRKKSICDVVLPSKKNISRQHAFVSYDASTNKVRLECNGTNGIVIVLPRQLGCHVTRVDPSTQLYELRTDTFCNNIVHDKQVEKNHELTSFVLLKGETILMPFIVGTIIDFRQAEAILTMKQSDSVSIEEDDNSTETDDEMYANSGIFYEKSSTPSKKLVKVIESPPTMRMLNKEATETPEHSSLPRDISYLASQEKGLTCFLQKPSPFAVDTTPQTSSNIMMPSTPKKMKEEFKLISKAPETPLVFRENSQASVETHSRKANADYDINDEDQHKNKHHKSNAAVKSTAELLRSLHENGLNCKELQHVLANHLAFANVQQTPLYQLQGVNSKTSTLSREQLRALLTEESCIGVIYRQGKDAAGKPLDEEYYYDLENDPDNERRSLVTALKGGRSGLRSCRRTHKQYFWKKPAK